MSGDTPGFMFKVDKAPWTLIMLGNASLLKNSEKRNPCNAFFSPR
jgi:hypothetical protein